MSAIMASVEHTQAFQDKVEDLCEHSPDQAKCRTKASKALFCNLLQRSKPKLAATQCTKPRHAAVLLQTVTAPNMADLKKSICNTPAFKKEADKLANALGCSDTKKCNQYAADMAFCLALADEKAKFMKVDGIMDEIAHCKKIDMRAPELALVAQKKFTTFSFIQLSSHSRKAPEDELAKEMTHDLEMNFNKIAPFGKEDTAKELQDHAAKTQDTLVDAVENAEVAEIKRAVFRALTRLRAATIKEFDTIARLETQAIDAYNDAHHYRAENPLAHLHEDEAPVETDKLKSFH